MYAHVPGIAVLMVKCIKIIKAISVNTHTHEKSKLDDTEFVIEILKCPADLVIVAADPPCSLGVIFKEKSFWQRKKSARERERERSLGEAENGRIKSTRKQTKKSAGFKDLSGMFKLVKNSRRILHIPNLIKNVNVFNCQIDPSHRPNSGTADSRPNKYVCVLLAGFCRSSILAMGLHFRPNPGQTVNQICRKNFNTIEPIVVFKTTKTFPFHPKKN